MDQPFLVAAIGLLVQYTHGNNNQQRHDDLNNKYRPIFEQASTDLA